MVLGWTLYPTPSLTLFVSRAWELVDKRVIGYVPALLAG